MTTLDDLMKGVSDVLSNAFAAAATPQSVLAFEPIGLTISDAMFRGPDGTAYVPTLAVERVSALADHSRGLQNGYVTLSSLFTISGLLGSALQGARTNAAGLEALGAARRADSPAFDQDLGSLDGVPGHRYHPVYATPTDWYDPTRDANWVSHTIGGTGGATTAGGGPSTPPPPSSRPIMVRPVRLNWQLLQNATPQVLHPLPEAAVRPSPPVNVAALRMATAGIVPRPPTLATAAAFAPVSRVLPSSAVAAVAAAPTRSLPPLDIARQTAALAVASKPAPVTSSNFSLSFDHCVVWLQRPWVPQNLLMQGGWYLPGHKAGDIADGTGVGGKGLMPFLPTAFVVMRKLRISASWSDADLSAMGNAAAIGPFSILGSSFDHQSGALSCPGLQIVAWFCVGMPCLPPHDDPSLAGMPPAALTADQMLVQLRAANIDASVPDAQVRDWLGDPADTPYPALAGALLGLMTGQRLSKPVYLDVIQDAYGQGSGTAMPHTAADVDLDRLKAAVVMASNTRNGTAVTEFDALVGLRPGQSPRRSRFVRRSTGTAARGTQTRSSSGMALTTISARASACVLPAMDV